MQNSVKSASYGLVFFV